MIYRKWSLLTLPFILASGVVGVVGAVVGANRLWVNNKEKKQKEKGPQFSM